MSIYISISYIYMYIYIYIYIHTHMYGPYRLEGTILANRLCHNMEKESVIQECTSKGVWRQGILLKHRSSSQKSLCPVVVCPYLCSSELFVKLWVISCSSVALTCLGDAKVTNQGLWSAFQGGRRLAVCLVASDYDINSPEGKLEVGKQREVCLRGTEGVPRKGVWASVNMRVWTCKELRVKHNRTTCDGTPCLIRPFQVAALFTTFEENLC